MAKPEDTLTLETTQGKVVIAMRPDLAPGHVARIKELVKDGFYDGIVFHRVIDGFMAQSGDPTGTGMGGSDKPDVVAEFNKRGFVPTGGGPPEQLAAFVRSEIERWGKVVRAAGAAGIE